MRYLETAARSAELLRLAIALMAKHGAGMHPLSYAVWYEYAAGGNSALREDIDALTARKPRLGDEDIRALYQRHVADFDAQTAQHIHVELKRLLAEVSSSAAATGAHADAYALNLERFSTCLTADAAPQLLAANVVNLLRDTRDIKGTLTGLQTMLHQSRAEVEELRAELHQAREEALTDGLTGLANRKAFDRAIAALVARADESAGDLCLVLVDIDHFKRINDAHGHLFGDRVIRVVADVLKSGVKGRDTVARYGGEEFALLLPDTPLAGARAVVEQVRGLVERSRIRRTDTDEIVGSVTVSAGVARHCRGETIRAFINRADAALYAAKGQGRNQVTLAAES